jgi:Cu(I)/Ag(I) efflux system membrane protein CusA/SilA
VTDSRTSPFPNDSSLNRFIRFCLEKKLAPVLLVTVIVLSGLIFSPFDFNLPWLTRHPVSVDAIPDIGENQQIVVVDWPGRSPRDVENQITYPLTAAMMGLPRVKAIRSTSMLGFAIIFVIFEEDVEFYWGRTRILEKLSSLPAGTLPADVQPALGPDATALGQVFWYTLEGVDTQGKPIGGWDLHELRSIQDWYVRLALLSVEGVSEVASIGGFVREYQLDVDPGLMTARNVKIEEIVSAVQRSNIDVGARTIEVNRVDYVIRGLGYIKSVDDINDTLVSVNGNVPTFIRQVARVSLGPAYRSGLLDKGGQEAVGGVVVVRYGENPLEVIHRVRNKIEEIAPGLPRKELPDGVVSQVRIVPFYDRTGLIHETLGTLSSALYQEVLVTILVIFIMLRQLRMSLLVCSVLPLAVLTGFTAMKLLGVQANVVALSGIAIAIGTLGDMGIIIAESIYRRLENADSGENLLPLVYRGAAEVGGAVVTAVMTTLISFAPVFLLTGAEGKLFRPLAMTKTLVILASVIVALAVIPAMAHALFGFRPRRWRRPWLFFEGLIYVGGLIAILWNLWIGVSVAVAGGYLLAERYLAPAVQRWAGHAGILAVVGGLAVALARDWLPLGLEAGLLRNMLFITAAVGGLMGLFALFQRYYALVLSWCLDHKRLFLAAPLAIVVLGAAIWLGFTRIFGWLPELVRLSPAGVYLAHAFPGLGTEFMPTLDEGSFLYMPSTMPHASISEVLDIVQIQDRAIESIPEVASAIGKAGRVESALDPAPISMIETLIHYRPQYITDPHGRHLSFRFDPDQVDLFRDEAGHPVPAADGRPYLVRGRFLRDSQQRLIPDPRGKPFRLWRPALDPALNPGRNVWKGIQSSNDIWACIVAEATLPGTTVAPKLQPISARIVMLQSGIRASMGVRVKGPDLETIERVSQQIEQILREVPSLDPASVVADRIMGVPYLEVHLNRRAMAQFAVDVQQVQDVIEFAIGGKRITTTVEGRERYPVRVRYMRELRDDLDSVGRVLVPSPSGTQIPLNQLADIRYVPGPQMIRSEDTFLVGYVLFEKHAGVAEGDAFEHAGRYLRWKVESGQLQLPYGVSYSMTGNYENQVRSQRSLRLIIPIGLTVIFLILYVQFKSYSTAGMVFICIAVNWAGAMILLWLYQQSWFLNFMLVGVPMREVFQVHPMNLSVAVWVGFLALFGVSSDDGVVMGTYLNQRFAKNRPRSVEEVRRAVVETGQRRIRPCLMTMATTLLALLPVLTSSGRGADLMWPMSLPSFGGLSVELITMLILPVLFCAVEERRLKTALREH